MPTLPVYDLSKKKVGSIELSDAIFAAEPKIHVLNSAVRQHFAKKYERKTANTLTRSEVAGKTQKAYKQKGTGQARHGAETAPIFVGGSKAHGPRPHIARKKMNKRQAQSALIQALSLAQKEDRLYVVQKFELDKHSTKGVISGFKAFGVKKALVVNPNGEAKEQFYNRSTHNIYGVKVLPPEGVNVFDILKYQTVFISEQSAKALTERLSNA